MLAILLMCMIGWFAYVSMMQLLNIGLWVNHTYEVVDTLNELSSALKAQESGVRGYVLTGHRSYIKGLESGKSRINNLVNVFCQQTQDNPYQVIEAGKLRNLVQQRQSDLLKKVETRTSGGLQPALSLYETDPSESISARVDAVIADAKAHELSLLVSRQDRERASTSRAMIVEALLVALAFVLLALFWVLLLRYLRQRELVESKLQASEQRFRLLVEGVKDYAIFMLDTNGNVTTWNAGAEAIKRYKASEIIGKHFSIFYTPEELAEGQPEKLLAQAREKGSTEVTQWRVRKGGFRFWADVLITALRDETGQLRGYAKITRDLTEQKRAEETKALAVQLARSNVELKQFAYVASHDLQEPLRAISIYSDLLLKKQAPVLNDEGKEYLQDIAAAATRMKQLIQDLLSFTRIELSERQFQPVDLNEVVNDALGLLKIQVEETKATVEISDLPEVLGDKPQLVQLFQNLISNGIKFHGPQAPVIRINACKVDSEWQVTVADNGIGIEPRFFERIFVMFQRLHTVEDYAGSGIGLALCKKIVERHGGRIWLESVINQGSTFYLTIPDRLEKQETPNV